ncbi:MAG: hypothetical protein QOH88_465 [Verrucomicrobiota bacterium]|jgi:hypothetical protein
MELYRRVDEVLHYIWDPIGVAGTPEARDEYYSYLPHVFSLVQSAAPREEITTFLLTTASEDMGLIGRHQLRKRAEEVTEILERWRHVIAERPPTA